MSEEKIMDKILDRYGSLGGLVVGLAGVILLLTWIFLCMAYPVLVFAPVLLAAWMIAKVMGDSDD